MLKEISFDYNKHRYAVRCYDGRLPLQYQCDFKPSDVKTFMTVVKESKRDTSEWRRQLGIK
jgi:hypothetical protein